MATPGKRSPLPWIIGIVVLVLLLCAGVIGTAAFFVVDGAVDEVKEGQPRASVSAGPATGETVRYEIDGTGRLLNLTHTEAGGSKTLNDVQLPWRGETPCCDEFDYTLIGVLDGSTKGPVTCRIFVDDKKVVENTSPTAANCTWLPE